MERVEARRRIDDSEERMVVVNAGVVGDWEGS